ncbi:hypothetical protein IV203_016425 [Nitzschia inconspicua]|uniref:Uncharacterized protein n=1 Tax=Nitzschia inconspicua TaxID=303405 RepID=A0A9K3KQ17_9STRA|nr:hypothetical protein IV203_016425 [Nitzschia inconspicua]
MSFSCSTSKERSLAKRRLLDRHNETIKLLENGDHSGAMTGLSDIVSAWRNLVRQDLLCDPEAANTVQTTPMTTKSVDPFMTTKSQFLSQSHSTNDCDDESFYLYETCIRFPCDFDPNYYESSLVSCVIVFNLALAHQLAAHGKKSDTLGVSPTRHLLVRAFHLYDLCFKLSCTSQSLQRSVLYRLAVANNLGVLCLTLRSNSISVNYFEYVLTTLMVMTTHGSQGKLMKRHKAALEGFFANVIRFRICGDKAAPAA